MIVRTSAIALAWMCAAVGVTSGAHAQQAVFETKSLTPETALIAAKAALEHCRNAGYQVSVAIVDRSGLPQVLLRDRYAGAQTSLDRWKNPAGVRVGSTSIGGW